MSNEDLLESVTRAIAYWETVLNDHRAQAAPVQRTLDELYSELELLTTDEEADNDNDDAE